MTSWTAFKDGRYARAAGMPRTGIDAEWLRGWDDRDAEMLAISTAQANLRAQVAAEIEHAATFQPTPKFKIGGQFVSDCAETMAGMFIIRDTGGKFIGATESVEMRARIVELLNQHGE